jgi:hypothetical protein
MAQNNVDDAFDQLSLALSGEVHVGPVDPDEVEFDGNELTLVEALELLVIGSALCALSWAYERILAQLQRRADS